MKRAGFMMSVAAEAVALFISNDGRHPHRSPAFGAGEDVGQIGWLNVLLVIKKTLSLGVMKAQG